MPFVSLLTNSEERREKAKCFSAQTLQHFGTQQSHVLICLKSPNHHVIGVPVSPNKRLKKQPLSDKDSKIYSRVVLSHTVKETWCYYGEERVG